MSVSKYTSEVKIIDQNQTIVYHYLSNFENLSKYVNEGLLQKLTEQVPQVSVSDFNSDRDSCSFQISGMGRAGISIVSREPEKTIKIESNGNFPAGLTFWIQLLPVTPSQCKMRLTLHADMSMMIKMMVGNKREKGIDQLADVLARLPSQ